MNPSPTPTPLTPAEVAAFEKRIKTRKVTKPSSHPALEAAGEWLDACMYMDSRPTRTREYYEAFFACDTAWEKMVAALQGVQQQAEPADALHDALKPFADWGRGFGPHAREDSWVIAKTPSGKTLTMGDIREAVRVFDAPQAALSAHKGLDAGDARDAK